MQIIAITGTIARHAANFALHVKVKDVVEVESCARAVPRRHELGDRRRLGCSSLVMEAVIDGLQVDDDACSADI